MRWQLLAAHLAPLLLLFAALHLWLDKTLRDGVDAQLRVAAEIHRNAIDQQLRKHGAPSNTLASLLPPSVDQAEVFLVNGATTRSRLSFPLPPRGTDTALIRSRERDRDDIAAVAWLQESDHAVVVRVPAKNAYAAIRRGHGVLGGTFLFAMVLVVGITFRSTSRLVRHLEQVDGFQHELRGQLFNAAKLASVGEMAAGVAHEINNPLAIIYEEAGALKDALDPELGGGELQEAELKERLDQICEATMRGRSITRKLLAFARQHDDAPELVDIHTLLDRVLDMKGTELAVSNIEVVRDFCTDPPSVRATVNQLEQVLFNLLNNARDAIRGRGRITVCTRVSGGLLHIDVQDTGCGMTADQMEKVFFPFFTTKAVGKGTGLGLSISYGIVKSHGGRIEVSSEVGEGTTFTVSLPISEPTTGRGRA
jgi:two-component system NtrC family sensor kinase